MSERKTEEIKFRCTPSFKARVQAAAAAETESMGAYLERAALERMTYTEPSNDDPEFFAGTVFRPNEYVDTNSHVPANDGVPTYPWQFRG